MITFTRKMRHHLASSTCIVLIAVAMCGCEPTQPDANTRPNEPVKDSEKPVQWRRFEDSTVVAVDDAAVQQALESATTEAKATLEDARQRWSVSKTTERALWIIKWAAPRSTSAVEFVNSRAAPEDHGAVEYVGVQPLAWSAFRIEGTLISHPMSPLECGKSKGDVVSFPIEEVADWIHFASDAPDAAFEGGFTVRVLEERYGKSHPTSR